MTENAAGVAVQDETDPPSGQEVPGQEVPGQEVSGQEVSGDAQNTGDQGTGSHSGDAAAAGSSSMSKHDLLVAEGDAAGDYLERLLDILDFDGDIDLDVEGERAVVSIIGDGDVDRLVGDHGEVLDALQELTRLAAMAETGQRSRLMLDIAGYRAKRRAELTELGRNTAEQVADSGEPVRLAPMNPFERKVVHDAVGTVAGVESSSEGEEPRRRVVVSPAS
jgi:spoIIIJ-associated protein